MKRKVEQQLDVPKAMLVVNVAEEFPTFVEISHLDAGMTRVDVRSPNIESTREALAITLAMAEALMNAIGARANVAIAMTKFEKQNDGSIEEPPFE